MSTLAHRLFLYQKERFPIIVLIVSLVPAILSSGAVIIGRPTIAQTIMALIISVVYLFHIRVIDEYRDFDHDNTHHANRPIQIGLISKKELSNIDRLALIILFGIVIFSGINTAVMALFMVSYSYLAGKEFFVAKKIRRHFFLYNAVNLVQMLLLQLCIYSVFTPVLSDASLIVTHFAFTAVGTILVEFIRKLRIPGKDGSGKDTYTWYLGFPSSLLIYGLLTMADIFLFVLITRLIAAPLIPWLVFSCFLAIVLILITITHWLLRKRITDKLLQLSFLVSYGLLNIIIFWIRVS